jgi:subtilisin family serine protease
MVRDSLRITLLAAAILPFVAAPFARAVDSTADTPTATYLIRFAEPGMFEARLDMDAHSLVPRSPEVIERRANLVRTQSVHEAAIVAALGRQPLVTHHYLASRSGIAARLTEAEAERLRELAGIVAVIPDRVEYLATFRTPAFIGADAIWNGSATPGLVGTRGEGTIVGVIDTGITPGHPSFADSASCSDDGIGAKLLSYVDCATTDAAGRCNGPDPLDHVGHGTHTAATAAGSRVEAHGDAPPLAISGIAPCAHIRAYKACPGTSCSYSYLIAALDNVLLDGDVDAVNYSIAGGTDPWHDTDRTKLDLVASGVFVAASAGNTNPAQTNPVGRVNHLGPWVVSVAASSHDVWADGLLDVAGPGTPPIETSDIQLFKASDSPNLAAAQALPIRHFADQPATWEGCSAGVDGAPVDVAAFPPGFFAGAAALVRNAGCPLVTQIENARAAGAVLVLIRADAMSDNTRLQTPGQADLPAYGIEQAPGDALATFVDSNPDSAIVEVQPVQGDALAEFSLRGPTPQTFSGLTKPDVSAPGVRVYSAFALGNGYEYLDGTSMASPHVAGAAALIRSVHPDWSVQEVASALMTTAKTEGVDDSWARHWDWDEVGSGRIDLNAAARAGFVLDESIDHFLASDPVGGSFAPRDLNIASVRDVDCTPSCTWIRELRGTRPEATHWVVSSSALDAGLDIHVTPNEFSLAADGRVERGIDRVFADGFDPPPPTRSQVIAITATPPAGAQDTLAFGQVVLTEVDGLAPPQHITVTVSGARGGSGQPDIDVLPAAITAAADDGNDVVTRTLVIANNDNGTLEWSHVTEQTVGSLWAQPADGTAGILSSESTTQDGGVYTANDFHLAARTLLTAIRTPGIDAGGALDEQAAITWAIYPDLAGKPAGNPQTAPGAAIWHYSSAPDGAGVSMEQGEIRLDLEAAAQEVDLPAGLYWLSVYPTYANDVTGSAPHWKWLQASRADLGAQLIAPTIYGVTSWSPITSMGVGFSDTAFHLEGRVGGKIDCHATWIAVSPRGGQVEGAGAQTVTIRLDPGQLAPGTHAASLCFDSNDPDEPAVIVPVTFTVGNG